MLLQGMHSSMYLYVFIYLEHSKILHLFSD